MSEPQNTDTLSSSAHTLQSAVMQPTVDFVQSILGGDLLEVVEYRNEVTLVAPPNRIREICLALRDNPALQYTLLEDVTAVDWPDRTPRFDIIYHIASLSKRLFLRLKSRIGADGDDDTPHISSVTSVWPSANWFEREVFDLFGVVFDDHPDLKRILMPNDWDGYPLRKDYPLTGIVLPAPHWGGQITYGEPLPQGEGQLTLRNEGGIANTPESEGN